MEKVAVIGAGSMGRQIALHCALKGIDASLYDLSGDVLKSARKFSDEYLESRVVKNRITDEQRKQASARMIYADSLESCVAGASVVIEAIIEDFAPKAELFKTLGQLCLPPTILASNSSNIVGSRLASVTEGPERVINLHFFNPVLVMDLVEVVLHPSVTPDVERAALKFCNDIGRTSIVVRKEVPGFVVNRIFRALTREAMNLLEGGYASAEDIDLAVTRGLGHPMGPFYLMDVAGVDVTYLARLDEYRETGDESAKPNEILKKLYSEGRWGKKVGKGFYDYPEVKEPGGAQ
ncbi:MAG: 3-hydroxyacyl-CoA dehydrogenase family protein [Actinomycetota bacterium]|jgi:3-hydroxybutyryl-CoA dehydrogenase|nr:3-hydroxyacyl-CoA dehydrogenase family protein [Actinomycetota bacterium]